MCRSDGHFLWLLQRSALRVKGKLFWETVQCRWRVNQSVRGVSIVSSSDVVEKGGRWYRRASWSHRWSDHRHRVKRRRWTHSATYLLYDDTDHQYDQAQNDTHGHCCSWDVTLIWRGYSSIVIIVIITATIPITWETARCSFLLKNLFK